jgi:hypothetical protein
MGNDDELERESKIHHLAYEAGDKVAPLLFGIASCSIGRFQSGPPGQSLTPVFSLRWVAPDHGMKCSANHIWADTKRSVALENRKNEVHRRVCELHEGNERRPIDEGLFERVGQEMNPGGKPISKTVISDLYYRVERALRRLPKTSAK